MTMIETTDSRFVKAIALAERSGSWLKLRDSKGHCKAVGIPSSRGDGRYYIVTRDQCDCEDQRRHPGHPCKHRQALEIAIARRQPELPARVVVDGLSEMVRQRACRYDDIFKCFEGD